MSFYIENEEEFERAVRLLESLFDMHDKPTDDMLELQKSIVEWETKNEEPIEEDIELADSEGKPEPR